MLLQIQTESVTVWMNLFKKSISRLDRTVLKESFSRGKEDDPRYKQQWKMEFYHAAISLLADNQNAFTDIGHFFCGLLF
jgi:hypothetical protein